MKFAGTARCRRQRARLRRFELLPEIGERIAVGIGALAVSLLRWANAAVVVTVGVVAGGRHRAGPPVPALVVNASI